MRLQPLALVAPVASAAAVVSSISDTPPSQHIFSNPTASPQDDSAYRIPTSRESAVLARRILALTPLGVLSTIFPPSPNSRDTSSHGDSDTASTSERRPDVVSGMPIGLMDYISDCEDTGNPTILAINIATTFKNAAAGSNISLAITWTPPYLPDSRIESVRSTNWLEATLGYWLGLKQQGPASPGNMNGEDKKEKGLLPYSGANLPRFSILGYLEKIPLEEVESKGIQECFVKRHRDVKYWLPGNRIHHSEWVRLVVQDVYWIGGFGDRAYIGWIPLDEWTGVEKNEWEEVRLPGEKKGWKEWSVGKYQDGVWEL